MDVAILLNDRRDREEIVAGAALAGIASDTYATATQALTALTARRFDLIVMDAKTYPGFGCTDAVIREIATILPDSKHIETLLYWQVALRVLERIREPPSVNAGTPVMLHLPELPEYSFDSGDILTRDAVMSDLRDKGPVDAPPGMPMRLFVAHVADALRARMADTSPPPA